jgi:hypothetical protein
MNVKDVESMARDVIVHHGLPFTLLSVIASSRGWEISARPGTGEVVRFSVADGRPVAVRVTIHENLSERQRR